MRDLRKMYSYTGYYNSTFKAKLYMDSTRDFYEKFHEIFEELNKQAVEASEEIEQIYEAEEEKEEIKEIKKSVFARRMQDNEIPEPDRPKLTREMQKIIDGIADDFLEETKKCVSNRKGKLPKGRDAVNLAIYEVMYIFPAFIETDGQFGYEIAKTIGEKWPEAMNGNKLGCADYKTIDSGFKRKLCYITTAVCENLGKPDDCEELTLLRGFRDGYMMNSEKGRKMISEYYDRAPGIVMRIGLSENRNETYDHLYRRYILPCTEMIKKGKNDKCLKHYSRMVNYLS